MPNQQLTLSFDIRSEWHISTGDEGGAYADALMLKDQNHLPYISGRSVRGLLKEAFQIAQDNQWLVDQPHLVNLLFGEEGEQTSSQGLLRITNATLSGEEIAYFKEHKQSGAHKQLYRVHYATAIDNRTGVAKEGSLRGMEVAAPMTLTSTVSLNNHHPNVNEFDNSTLVELINSVTPLITNVGAKKHRGYGQAFVTVDIRQGGK
ncbi:RAMP superfamily CRISPR-associated protein [Vibrio sp. MarTm2]|uniref:RAMP superfamily CRISPR-associated protein n=1 Tax=Vibrio sp. MarTm2 TaxID=2998831 RepID=UPI0022CD72D5|nr:RAMP superfamily CRISPR-associated protein [Vibrio sp. MarTm2]MDA0129452.1 RAMP superfamily CRISPR-associated protein [Vibrio sp. MarTm2]